MVEVTPGDYINLAVADTGPGMDADVVSRIFEPYFTTKEKGEGTGLGLFVVHGIVQRFNGWMDVESQPGKGTVFSIYFPRIEEESVDDLSTLQTHPTGTETILLVDDDKRVVEMTSELLGALDYRVIPAAGGDEALQLFAEIPNNIDLVITDQTMPGITGEVLSTRLREIKPGIPIIICTGYSETMNPRKASEVGINGFLMKPVEMRQLACMIRQVLDDGQPSDSCS